MSIKIDVSELNRIAVDLEAAGARAGRMANKLIRKTAFDMERDAKTFAPVDTGNLRSSIRTSVHPGGLAAEITPTAAYAHFVELGTSRMAPHAFMGPALDRNTPDFIKGAEQIAFEALDG